MAIIHTTCSGETTGMSDRRSERAGGGAQSEQEPYPERYGLELTSYSN